MRVVADRRFTIGDAMILVAAAALGMAWNKDAGVNGTLAWPGPRSPLLNTVANWAQRPMLVLVLGWAVLRLRRPRPAFRRLIRQPGSAMGFAAVAGISASLLFGATSL